MSGDDLGDYLERTLGHRPNDLSLFERALSHSSSGPDSYERLEFLGDRVLGLIVARWLYERFEREPEGKLSRRYNVLVARETCGTVGRDIGLPARVRLGKQAREDGANQSDNVIGDVVEALIGALFLDGGFEAAERFVRSAWEPLLESQKKAPKHPKSALQELAASRGLAAPHYELVGRTGAHHLPRFTVTVSIRNAGEASADGTTKQEAETAAAEKLLDALK
jgi:ribonuclease-3